MGKRLVTEEDLYKMKFTGSPVLSPDGQSVVYVVTEVSEDKNGYYSSLYINDLEGASQRLTHPYSDEKLIRDTMPKWSPNGETIAFLSNRSEKNQVWVLPMNGGEARQLTHSEEGVSSFNWAPDGKRIVFTSKEKVEDKEENEDVTVVTRLRYKGNGEGFREGYSQVWLVDLETEEATKLTSGSYNHHSPSFAPSGNAIIYLAAKQENRELENLDSLYLYNLKNRTEKALYEGKGPVTAPTISPDGKLVAFAGHEKGEVSSANLNIWTIPIEGGQAQNLSAGFDRPVGNYVGVDATYDQSAHLIKWSGDGKSILFQATLGGDCGVIRISPDGETEETAVFENS
ncbi:MAG TPA: S9 family peptidase, partial [Bacillales bacterium]